MLPPCLHALERSHLRHAEVVYGLLTVARRLAATEGALGDLRDDLREIDDAMSYFYRSVPRHFQDEEESLFPRLAERLPARAAELAKLAAEHPAHLALHRRLDEAARDFADRPSAQTAKALYELAAELDRVYEDHAGREDELFEQAASALTREDLRAIDDEMERRRGRGGGGGGGGGGGAAVMLAVSASGVRM